MVDILGIGVDIESVDRFKNKPENENKKFYKRIFTPLELQYCFNKRDPYPHLAARFAAKEAVIKAFSGLKKLFFSQIEVRNDKMGKPHINIKIEEAEILDKKVLITISHCSEYAVAFAVVKKE